MELDTFPSSFFVGHPSISIQSLEERTRVEDQTHLSNLSLSLVLLLLLVVVVATFLLIRFFQR